MKIVKESPYEDKHDIRIEVNHETISLWYGGFCTSFHTSNAQEAIAKLKAMTYEEAYEAIWY